MIALIGEVDHTQTEQAPVWSGPGTVCCGMFASSLARVRVTQCWRNMASGIPATWCLVFRSLSARVKTVNVTMCQSALRSCAIIL